MNQPSAQSFRELAIKYNLTETEVKRMYVRMGWISLQKHLERTYEPKQ